MTDLLHEHRGQDAVGLGYQYEGKISSEKIKRSSLDIFRESHMKRLLGHIGVGHVRHPTAGSSSRAKPNHFT